jgi:hypothetical protein
MWPQYSKPFYFHFRDMKHLNGVTVCMQPIKPGMQSFRVGVSCCSQRDNFSKRIGRRIAEGRASVSSNKVEAGDFRALAQSAESVAVEAEKEVYKNHTNLCHCCSNCSR